MKTRIITGALIFIVTVGLVFSKLLTPYILDLALLVIGSIALIEMSKIFKKMNKKCILIFPFVTFYLDFIILHLLNYIGFNYWVIFLVAIALKLFVFGMLALVGIATSNCEDSLECAFNSLLISIYPTFMVESLIFLNNQPLDGGKLSIVLVSLTFLVPMLTDTFALFVGTLCRGPKLAPKVSPSKTWSGFVGGLIGGVLAGIICYIIFSHVPYFNNIHAFALKWWFYVLVGLVASVIGQVGDLFESFCKRKAGIKDSGNLFPGHGGMLDRIDNMLFVSFVLNIVMLFIL